MPSRPLRACNYPGCGTATKGTYCEEHVDTVKTQVEKHRLSAHQRGYTSKWRKYSKRFLAEHPFCECEDCKRLGIVRGATVVDHIVPHKGDMKLFWNPKNHQAMAKTCHDRKTATEDGRWGTRPTR